MQTNLPDRFWAKVQKTESGCWLWTGAKYPNGCGLWYVKIDGVPKTQLVHRVVYADLRGPIPKGALVCHKCDVRNCVNPDHLFLGTHSDNTRDMDRKGRRNRGDISGEKNPKSKLNAGQVGEIRKLIASGMRYAQIAERFPVGVNQISNIATGNSWS